MKIITRKEELIHGRVYTEVKREDGQDIEFGELEVLAVKLEDKDGWIEHEQCSDIAVPNGIDLTKYFLARTIFCGIKSVPFLMDYDFYGIDGKRTEHFLIEK